MIARLRVFHGREISEGDGSRLLDRTRLSQFPTSLNPVQVMQRGSTWSTVQIPLEWEEKTIEKEEVGFVNERYTLQKDS